MKKTLLFCLSILLFASLALAQQDIPNSNFEDWDENDNPVGWQTPNPFLIFLGEKVVFKNEDAIQGSYSVKMETKVLTAPPPVGEIPVPGLITLGEIVVDFVNQTGAVTGGVPFTARPYALTTFLKASQAENDSALIGAFLFRYDQQNASVDTIAIAMALIGEEIEDWTELEIPFIYLSEETPDSINVVCISSASFESSYDGSMLMLDDLKVKMESGIELDLLGSMDLKTYPNPAHGKVTFEIEIQEIQDVELQIFDTQGKILEKFSLENNVYSLDISDYASATYFYRLTRNNKKLAGGFFIKE
ncbi:MAG: T9SS type A sorting domain-containing protein [Bacteroidota bacterium]|nr:T9SS type A sorting domain-containing protein [Bacteroidota bacterium]